jgi:ribose transport system substrate-binding protein
MKKVKSNVKLFSLIVFALLLSLVAAGCGSTNTSSQATSQQGSGTKQSTNSNQIKLGFSFGQSVHPFFIAMQKGAQDEAKKEGAQLDVTSANFKLESQLSDVEDLLQKNVNAILLNPIDSKALANPVNDANSKNVGVFTVDIGVIGAKTTSHIASDNKEIGRMAARYINDQLHGKGKIALIGDPTITSLMDRESGFKEELAKYPGIKLVANQGGAIERAKSLTSAENILQAHPDIDAFFGINESAAMGELGALQSAGLKKPFIIGVDSTPDLLNSIKNKTQITATIAQDPYQMGVTAVQEAIKHIKGESVPSNIPVQIDLVTKDNVQKFITRDAHYQKK